jgi:hypothetical protein
MSIELHIFMSSSRVPSVEELQSAIDLAGFPATLDAEVDIETHTGFWPATYKGKQTGFEFYLDPVTDLLEAYPHVAPKVGDRAKCATFRWGGHLLEMCAALSTAAALAKLTDGIYFYPDDDILYGSEEAMQATVRDLASVSV